MFKLSLSLFSGSMGFDKWIMSCVHNYIIIQNRFTALKTPCAYLIILPPQTPDNH